MFNIHPHTYTFIYFHVILLVVLITAFRLYNGNYKGTKTATGAFLFALTLLLFIGLRPYNIPGVGQYFGDTINYYRSFEGLASGAFNPAPRDIGFDYFTLFCARYFNAGIYFFLLSALYILPLFFAIRRITHKHTFLLFLLSVVSFLFWSNAVNGLRIGIASSFFLLGVTFRNKRWIQIVLFIIAASVQKSILLVIGPYILTLFYNNSKMYLIGWFSSIALSLMFGGFWESFFAGLNLGDERFAENLLSKPDPNVFAYTGFRWDFLLYSAVPVALGSYYIFKKKYRNTFYIQLFNTYLIANSFWILIIRATFSNRFASLSWIIFPLILILPLLKVKIWENQTAKIALILSLSFAFTYFMSINVIWR